MKEKVKVLKDTGYSVCAVVMMNVVVQFLIYPLLERHLGTAGYGDFIYMTTFINIIAATIGSGINLERMKLSINEKTCNGDFVVMIFSLFIAVIPCCIMYVIVGKVQLTVIQIIFFLILCFFTVLRNYGDVDFRLRLDYKNYFLYYLALTVGYIIGLVIGIRAKNWILIFFWGETCALIYLFVKGEVIKEDPLHISANLKKNYALAMPVVTSILLSNLIFNMDRIVLKWVCGSAAVSIYYIASLFGKTMSLISLPLNNVAIGYLTKSKVKMDYRKVSVCALILLAFALVCGCLCTIGSYIVLPFLYPNTFELSKGYFIVANFVSVVYFITSFMTIILLRYGKEKYQLWLNAVYAILFVVICIPACIMHGVWGMCISLLIVNLGRFVLAWGMSIYSVGK